MKHEQQLPSPQTPVKACAQSTICFREGTEGISEAQHIRGMAAQALLHPSASS